MLKTTNNERIYHDQYNNLAYASKNGIKEGCEITESSPVALSVEMAIGKVFVGEVSYNIAADTLTGFVAPDGINKRIDLVALSTTTQTLSILSGETLKHPSDPRPASYEPDDYVILARVTFNATDSVVSTSNIKDLRVLNEGGGSGGSSGVGRFTESFTTQTSITVTHNLGDVNPMVQAYDSNNEQITANKIDIVDANNVLVEFSVSETGFITVHGGTGVDVGTSAYYSQNFTAQTSVVVAHGMGLQYPQVQVYDENDKLVEPQEVVAVDTNNAEVWFGTTSTGKIIVVGGASQPAMTADILPDTDNAYDLGNDAYRIADVNTVLLNAQTPAGFKKSSSSFTASTSVTVVIDSFCNADSLVTVAIDATTSPVGVWSVDSESGQFTITSDATETAAIDFEYYIQRGI